MAKFHSFVAMLGLCAPLLGYLPPSEAASYYVRVNSLGGDLLVDDETRIDFDRTNSNGYAYGYADLALGKLSAYSQSNSDQGTNSVWFEFGDTVTVLGVVEPTTVTISVRVFGTMQGAVPQVNARLSTGDGGFTCTNFCALTPLNYTDFGQYSSDDSFTVDDVLSIDVPVTPSDSVFSFLAYLQLSPQRGGIADFSNTASLALSLPQGLTFSSESGVLLSAVPEPTPAMLFLAGLGLVWAFPRFRRMLPCRSVYPD